MRRLAFLTSLLAVFLAAVVLLATDGPLTPIAQLRGRTDQNGYLLASSGISGGTDGPLTPIGQLRGRTEQNGYLRVALAGSSSLTGLTVTQGTLTADAQALSSTATWNNAGVTFTHWLATITDTASAAGSKAVQILGGAAGATPLFAVTKGGNVNVGGSLLTIGGTSASEVAWKRTTTVLNARLADDSGDAKIVGGNIQVVTAYQLASNWVFNTAPTMGACGTSPSIVASNGTGAFRIQVGNAAATTCVVNLPAAPTGWHLSCDEFVAPNTATGDFLYRQTATTTTSATLSFYNNTGTLTAPTNNANLVCSAFGY